MIQLIMIHDSNAIHMRDPIFFLGVAAMVAPMGWLWLLLWLLPWDGYGCCYGCSHGIAMVLLWLLPWDRHGIAMVAAMDCCHGLGM